MRLIFGDKHAHFQQPKSTMANPGSDQNGVKIKSNNNRDKINRLLTNLRLNKHYLITQN